MTKDEALDLALKAFESIPEEVEGYLPELCTDAVIAIKQARSALVQPCNPAEDGVCESVECDCTTPPAAQRQWTGLTDEEIEDIVEECDGVGWDVAQAIKAKLKEKNA